MEDTLRLFIALDLPEDVRAVLAGVQARLAAQKLPVRWVDPGGAHLTLKFLGSTPRSRVEPIAAALEQVARQHPAFTLETADLGMFPNRRAPRVVWLGLGGATDALAALRDDVERLVAPLGFPTEERPWSPHLTLGRAARDASRSDLARVAPAVAELGAPAPLRWPVAAISLMRSELSPRGARYTALATVDLR